MKITISRSVISLIFLVIACQSQTSNEIYGVFETEDTTLAAKIAGKLIHFFPKVGDTIEAGAVVAIFDTARFVKTKKILESQLRAWEGNAAGAGRILETNAQNPLLQNRIQSLLTQIQAVDDSIEYSRVYAPFQGVASAIFTQAGEYVEKERPLVTISRFNPMILRAYLNKEQLSQIYPEQIVEITFETKTNEIQKIPGKIVRIALRAEPPPSFMPGKPNKAEPRYAVWALAPNNQRQLKRGMYGKIDLLPQENPLQNTMAD